MIDVTGATKRFRTHSALVDVDVEARDGEVTAVVGPNGAGKSTLFRAVLGLERLDAGRALVDGAAIASAVSPAATIGAAIDASAFHPGRRVIDELRIVAAAGRVPSHRITGILDEVALGHVARRRVRALSLGMRQRLALAAALIARPRNLVLDEPLNGLDVDGIHWMRDLLRRAADRGTAVLISSHILSELERVSDRITVLAAGRVVRTQQVTRDGRFAAATHVEAVCDDPTELIRLVDAHGGVAEADGRCVLIRGLDVRRVAEIAFAARLLLESLVASQDSLEQEYLRLLAEAVPDDPVLREMPGGRS